MTLFGPNAPDILCSSSRWDSGLYYSILYGARAASNRFDGFALE